MEIREDLNKNLALIVSGGRTGTKFIGKHMQFVFEDCVSFHEPDIIHQRSWPSDTSFVIREFGIYRGLIGKFVKRTGIRTISDRYLSGNLDDASALREIHLHRFNFYQRIPQSFIVESNYAFFGLLPLLPRLFPDINIAGIVRDPFTWIRSYLRKNDRYGSHDFIDKLGLRVNALMIGDSKASGRWGDMTAPEKLAWFYDLVYSRIDYAAKVDSNIRWWRYEDLFLSDEREQHFSKLCSFLGTFRNQAYIPTIERDLMAERINASPDRETGVPDEAIRRAISQWCPETAERFGYI